jgi:hypothetical protein
MNGQFGKQEMSPFGIIAIKGMKNILEGRKFDKASITKYKEFIGEDIKDKIKRKYLDLTFSVNIYLGSFDSPSWQNSNGYFCNDDVFVREEYKDQNWVCQAIINGVWNKNRDENRAKTAKVNEIETKAKGNCQKIMEKFLFGKIYDQSLTGRDLGKILEETNESFKFEFGKDYTFFVNCILVDKSKGTTEYGSYENNNKEEDLVITETYTTDKTAADKGIMGVVLASFFKIK